MSLKFDAATNGAVGKAAVEDTTIIVPKPFHPGGVSIEVFEGIEGYGGLTGNGKRDMGRMGKVQELKVRMGPAHEMT